MDAYVGQSGFEEAFEKYLHGIDGTRYDEVNRQGTTTNSYYLPGKEPVAGNNVETTIDIDIQQVAEEALEEVVLWARDPEKNTEEGEHTGLDAQGGAVVVMECKTGKILACASYPTYYLATMHEDWAEIEANEYNPFFNRAFGAEYPPGSTFKMCTLIAAMENKNSKGEIIHPYKTEIKDEGVYTK